ncbi:MAG: hypothetical protein U0Q22_14920 [Acidimicrobiales bacterium]
MVDDPGDLALMATIGEELVTAVDAALEPWVGHVLARFAGIDADRAADAARRCRVEITARLRSLVALDIDEQPTTPLVVIRDAARYPAEVLAAAGVPRPVRDPFDERMAPDDVYGLAPVSWGDLGPEVAAAGLRWGAAKAHLHLRRHGR